MKKIWRYACKMQYKKENILLQWEEYIDFLHDLEKDDLMEYYLEDLRDRYEK